MRFLLDMNLPPATAEWLRSEGLDAVHIREIGLAHLPDREVFARAAEEGRVVVTFDLDFGEIAGLAGATGANGSAVATPIGSPRLSTPAAPGGNCRGRRGARSWRYGRCRGRPHSHQADAAGELKWPWR